MNKRLSSVHFVARAALGSALLIAAAFGCSPPPDNSPSISITSPVNGQVLTNQIGKPIDVRFMVSGVDSSGPMPVNFQLSAGSTMIAGKGRVRAFIDVSNYLAETVSVPNDANPFNVPDGINGDAATFIKAGSHRITLQLYYNDSPNTKVDPQREGTVTVTIQ